MAGSRTGVVESEVRVRASGVSWTARGGGFSLDPVTAEIGAGRLVAIVGPSGAGKTTLLELLAGVRPPTAGHVRCPAEVGFVPQDDIVHLHLPLHRTLTYAARLRGTEAADGGGDPVDDVLGTLGLRHRRNATVATLSGGERKRAALALALALDPDLLLLDEPTNHLDIQGIERLEELVRAGPAAIVITHDRAFLDRVTTRIVELDRGVLRSHPGNFSAYETRKDEELSAEATANRRFDRFWAQEEVWIRKGVEARRTRNEGRVKRLERLREERSARRDVLGTVKLNLDAGERSGRLVAELFDVGKRFGERRIIEGLSMRIMRGDRIGVIGPNGAGKSTLLQVILGTLPPDSGRVKPGTNLQVAYFDQMRGQLDPQRTVAETISPGSDYVQVDGAPRHVVSYLADFLFPSQRARSPVRMLSGGERNRLLLARLFARPANLLVLDEPTNDLDIESLELLEQTLQDYAGTLLLVSHDRAFLDNVVTQTIAPEGDGYWREYVGGYTDWLQQRAQPAVHALRLRPTAQVREKPKTKLSYKDQRELHALPAQIEALEQEQAQLTARMSAPDSYYREGGQGAGQLRDDARRITEIEALLLERFARWEALERERGRST